MLYISGIYISISLGWTIFLYNTYVHIYGICRIEYISMGNICPYLWDRVYIYWKYMSMSMALQVRVNISGKSMRYMCVHIYWICRIEYISMGNICPDL